MNYLTKRTGLLLSGLCIGSGFSVGVFNSDPGFALITIGVGISFSIWWEERKLDAKRKALIKRLKSGEFGVETDAPIDFEKDVRGK